MNRGHRLLYRIGDADVDPAQACIRKPDQPDQYLRPKALQVLLYLLEHRDRAVTKDELLAHAWAGLAVSDDVLVGCVGEIRRALGDGPRGTQFIRTLPKVGYRFVATANEIRLEPDEQQPEVPSVVAGPPEPVPAPPRFSWHGMLFVALPTLAATFFILYLTRHPLPGRITSSSSHFEEVAWWKLHEEGGSVVSDSSRHGNTGHVKSPAWSSGGGRGLRFDGLNTVVAGLSACQDCPCGSAPRTLTAWIKAATTNGDVTSILSYGPSNYASRVNFELGLQRDGRAAFGFSYGPPTVGVTRLDDGSWHHLAATYEGSQTNMSHLFVDGAEEVFLKWPIAPDTRASAWRIGGSVTDLGTLFRGVIDDVRMYDRVLRTTEIQALYRCSSGQADQVLPISGTHYYLPVFSTSTRFEGPPAGTGSPSREIWNAGSDFAGIQIARSGDCRASSLEGEDLGQDLTIRVDLLVPTDAAHHVTEAGPYFRSRAAAAGDGIMGGTSAGYLVELDSRGAVMVKRLNPKATVAFTEAPAAFDSTVFHTLEMTARGPELQVILDGKLVTFDQAGSSVTTVSILPTWLGPPVKGANNGTAGIAFGSENNRSSIGGQRARNLIITQ